WGGSGRGGGGWGGGGGGGGALGGGAPVALMVGRRGVPVPSTRVTLGSFRPPGTPLARRPAAQRRPRTVPNRKVTRPARRHPVGGGSSGVRPWPKTEPRLRRARRGAATRGGVGGGALCRGVECPPCGRVHRGAG